MSDKIDKPIEDYKKFKLSKNGNRTVFWQFVYRINAALNPNQKMAITFYGQMFQNFAPIRAMV
jgi:hypothetical protein